MDKTVKIYLGALFGVIVLIVFIDMSRVKLVNWEPTYQIDRKNPLDLYVFSQEGDKVVPQKRIEQVKVTPFEYFQEHSEKLNMLYINNSSDNILDSVMLQKIAEGSNLFVSAETFNSAFIDTLGLAYSDIDLSFSLRKIDTVRLTLTNRSWEGKEMYAHPIRNSNAFVSIDTATTVVLGKMQLPDELEFPCFLKVKYGKGFIFIHNQPLVFTSYSLLYNRPSTEYVSLLLSYLPSKYPVVWFVQGQTNSITDLDSATPLAVIFRYPALRATWLIFLYGLLLYVLFNAKRRQRVVPVIKPLTNTTVEFVRTIGNLYFQEGSAANLMDKKIIYFLDRVRNRYFIETSKLDDQFAEKLQLKSGKNMETITEILQIIKDFRRLNTAANADLIRLNNLIESFWNNN